MSKKIFEELVRGNIKRDGIETLLTQLAKTDFYIAPASTRHHDSEEGGLVKHSIEVYNQLELERINLGYDLNSESCAIVALFHDLCKIGYYTTEMRNKKDDKGKWVQVPYYTVNDLFPFGHGEKSVYMIMQEMKITDEEALAIRWHMGLSVPKEDYGTMGKAFKESKLALLLHIADMKATYLE